MRQRLEFDLKKNDKAYLIEILLIVSALLTAIRLPEDIYLIFMMFVVCSIIYFIMIKSKIKDTKRINLFALLSAVTFSGIISSEIGLVLLKSIGKIHVINLPNNITITINNIILDIFGILIISGYYIVIAYILYKALKMKDSDVRKKESKFKKYIITQKLSEWENDDRFVKY